MAWSKPFDEKEIAYVKESFSTLSCAEIAHRLGRSKRGVEKLAKRLGLGESCAPARPRARDKAKQDYVSCQNSATPQDELSDMRELKKILKRTLADDIDPRAIPKLSAEYREVIRRISELEGGDVSAGSATEFELGSLLVSVPLRPS